MRKHIYILIVSLLPYLLKGQQVYDSISYDDVKAILRLYEEKAGEEDYNFFTPQDLFDTTSINHNDYTAEILNQEVKMIRSDVGLTFSATIQENLEDGIEEGSQNFTKTRLSAGLDWHLLSGGYYQNRLKARMVDNEVRIHVLDRAQKHRETNYYRLYNLVVYLHNQAKVKLLQKRINLLESISSFYHDLHASHLIDRKKIMEITEHLRQARQVMHSQKTYNEGVNEEILASDSLDQIDITNWPVYDINLENLLEGNGISTMKEENLRLRRDNLLLEERTKREWQFKLFARYTVNRTELDQTARQYPTVGASLQVPIYVGKGHRSQLYEYKSRQLESIHQFEDANLKKELMNHYYEYQYHLKQYFQFLSKKDYYDYSIKLDSIALSYDQHLISPLQLIDHTIARSAVELELLDLRQQLYLKLLKVYTLSGADLLNDFVIPTQPHNRQVSLILMVDQEAESETFLNAYVNLHNIEQLIESSDQNLLNQLREDPSIVQLEVSQFSSKSKLDQKIKELSEAGVKQIILDDWETLVALEMSTLNN